ncbi:MAG: ATP-binding protein [Deltaproteobacteria bacterium]|nr:ATP-binding protein [Deltaproteobacteria bacterium]
MVFIGGPRQVGKTTLALSLLKNPSKQNPAYLNWDVLEHKQTIRKAEIPAEQDLIILDEIHKFKRWRGLVKGLFDQYHPNKNFIVTGSARLDYYRKGGDSLLGRYHYWRLHPFSVSELGSSDSIHDLLQYGGFPEPFLKADKRFSRRWNRERLNRIINEDLRDLENVQDLSLIELLVDALPDRVGSQLSLNSLSEDLDVSPRTVDRWVSILERLYLCFRIAPFGSPKIRAVKKTNKLYLWDWSIIEESGIRFENLVASHLLKFCHYTEDREGHKMELRYIRDTDSREIDFVVLKNRQPLFAVECKLNERKLSKHINYFQERTKIPKFYQVHLSDTDFGDPEKGGRLMPFSKFAQELNLP